jgi:hypothetical protein
MYERHWEKPPSLPLHVVIVTLPLMSNCACLGSFSR